MEPAFIYRLLEKIHEFYPVGMQRLTGYPGEKRMMEIIEKKINALINEEQTEWTALFHSLKKLAANYQVIDNSARQFPSYTMSVLYEEAGSGELNRRTEIVFTISLLCEYYTCFIHDFYRIDSQILFSQRRKIYSTNVVSLENHLSFEKAKPIIERADAEIRKFFPGHTYVNHASLFYNKINGAVPFGAIEDMPAQPYSIYHFLFDGYFAKEPNITA
ncbi:hypothetical protein SAMN05660909_00829 [Chitinophaga terrae (ex Kim and Jung 2007)]|uniref:Uncharacterized protein n=1 Tax=Chitinophaga terrae (ex Kim and Jung 2007) TaxID=408074 RepID=A0A1H3YKR3_9BACT|nr:hypothetical protein [Chitinophaga terrae (ex Kim and Jung 2007)]SEA12083.1 hypothetical protein SAMN05660909_00829 [Chitinophaga terrae (ex Kim and Jung 2007)]